MRIKSLFFRDAWDLYILVSLAILGLLVGEVGSYRHASIFIIGIVVLYLLVYVLYNYVPNMGQHFLALRKSLIFRNRVWIAQKMFINSEKVHSCPQKVFVQEMLDFLKKIPEGTTCYCCTHTIIVNHILRKYPNAEYFPVYTKNLKSLKKALKNSQCDHCKSQKCTLLDDEEGLFYAIKFQI